jgi:hypothetical protein
LFRASILAIWLRRLLASSGLGFGFALASRMLFVLFQ